MFGRPVQFDAPCTCMVAERHWLDLPLPTHDPLTLKQVTATLESFAILGDSERDLVGAVQVCLRTNLAQAPDLAQLADMLFVSERTLRRRLADRNLSYKRLVDELRRDAALELLAVHVTMDDVASRVGFADSRALRRALKRWTEPR